MNEYITVTLESIRESGVWIYPVSRHDDYAEYKLTADDVRRIIEGYNNRVKMLRDKIYKLEKTMWENDEKTFHIPTGNKFGGGYGD